MWRVRDKLEMVKKVGRRLVQSAVKSTLGLLREVNK